MEHLPQLIFDLALLLTVAAIATIVCKKFNQPSILGYVIAGFLVGPAIGWFPNIIDTESISTWSEIGVIFLMFGLGLEFSVMKLTEVGKPGIITAVTEMAFMIASGILCGTLLGWDFFTSLFLGGMLAISSTTIIVKAFGELGMKGKKFTDLVFGSLIIEDIIGIFLMVFLSTIAVGTAVSGGAIALQIGQMLLYLVIWFVLCVILVPTLFKKVSSVLTDEILIVSSIALCLVMVVLANAIGFSSALGAFLAGSILAGTVQAHRIDELFKPVKDLFGAVFFVSVGMLVSPQTIVDNIVPIIVITVVTLIGKPLFTTLGALFSKQTLKTSVQTGMSLSQIGEFSFIIAALGVTLGVTADFLYPVIVAVSVVTTITTPFYIKGSEKVYNVVVKVLPQPVLDLVARRAQSETEEKEDNAWVNYLKHWIAKVLMVAIAAVASVELLSRVVRPFLTTIIPALASDIFTVSIALVIIGLFASNLFFSARKGDFGLLWVASRKNHIPLILLTVLSAAISCAMVVYVVIALEGMQVWWLVIPAVLLTLILGRSKWVHSAFLKFENLFVRNLNEGTLNERKKERSKENPVDWLEEQLYVTRIRASRLRDRRGQTISIDLFMGMMCNLDLLSIERDGKPIGAESIPYLSRDELRHRVADPDDELSIHEGDRLTFLGTANEVDNYLQGLVKADAVDEDDIESITLREFFADEEASFGLHCFRVQIDAGSEFKGKTIATSGMRDIYGCLVLALEHDALPKLKPSFNTRIAQNDYLWVLGSDEMARMFAESEKAVEVSSAAVTAAIPSDALPQPS